jgi:hypothetical protein
MENIVMEAAINKLCSILKIGPTVDLNISDVTVYNDAVVWHMEMCDSLS